MAFRDGRASTTTKRWTATDGLGRGDQWPFVDRSAEMDAATSALRLDDARRTSRALRIVGTSGMGKSFFVKELLARACANLPDALCIYVDVEERALPSAEIQAAVATVLEIPRTATRTTPQQVPRGAELRPHWQPLNALQGFLDGLRTVAPSVAGILADREKDAIDTLVPPLPWTRTRSLADKTQVWTYVSQMAKRRPVLLAIDGVQFLSESVRLDLKKTFHATPRGLRVILVERTNDDLDNGTDEEVLRIGPMPDEHGAALIERTLQGRADERLRAAVLRNAAGSPKQIWLQVQTLLRSSSGRPASTSDYAGTIEALPTTEYTILLVLSLVLRLPQETLANVVSLMSAGILTPAEIDDSTRFLVMSGLVFIDGGIARTEHELVRRTVRRLTPDERLVETQTEVLDALHRVLTTGRLGADHLELVIEAVVRLSEPEKLGRLPLVLGNIDEVVRRRVRTESFEYLATLAQGMGAYAIRSLPEPARRSLLDAFQKTSQFHDGIALVREVRSASTGENRRTLDLYEAKYCVQLFDYASARRLLDDVSDGSDKDAVAFNMLLNECEDDAAREIVASLLDRGTDFTMDECVMLRNSGHLYEPKRAADVLRLAMGGFRRHRTEFGVATTENNLGVVFASSGELGKAERLLSSASARLSSILSVEQYQPLSNCGVVAALSGRFDEARSYFQRSRELASPWLRMDAVMFDFNELVLSMMRDEISPIEALRRARSLADQGRTDTCDRRFQWGLDWFVHQVSGEPSPDEDFESRVRSNGRAGLEVFIRLRVGARTIRGFLELSPHWRY